MFGNFKLNGHILVGLILFIYKGHNHRINPILRSIFGPIFDFPFPTLTAGNGLPQILKEKFGVVPGVDQLMGLADQLFLRILGNLAEAVVDVGNPALSIRRGHNRRLVQGKFEIRELLE